ncbi:unnamed protein product [Paramecium octaurelia]|uniref:non-specific serine/threonine protein kinase n=1 Tax=Paramecium octaurelia TaxID=43137 RepID=A0A8S1TSZ3_PAROT|nr:unnamed protein product [Paramecium octaurelia]
MQRVKRDEQAKEVINVLLAEDAPIQRIALIDLLQLCNYQVVACETGIQARDELLKTENEFDLILLDLGLPEMTGLELLQIIKAIDKLKDVPVIMMSGDDETETVAACLNAGAEDYMVKPVNFKKLQGLQTFVKKKPKQRNNNQNEKGYYTIVRNIGKGASGSVELVRKSTDQELYAMKVIPTFFMNEQERKNAENEVSLLRVLTAPTIIKYYESFTENESLNIIMEYAEGGSLTEKISEYSRYGSQVPKDQVLAWMAQLVIAIHFMHSKNILHRDIKTQNMFLNKEQVIKLGDFGISKALGTHANFAQTFLGTPYFMSPEVIRGEPYGKKSDIWALGCALYELVMLKRPFQHDNIQIIFEMIQNKPYDMDPSVDLDLQQLIEKTLQKDPNNRPTVEDLAAIPCIEEKINQFYKDHPNETNLISVKRLQLGPQLQPETTEQVQDENYVAISADMIEKIQLRKIVYGFVNQIEYIGVLGQDILNYLQKACKNQLEIQQVSQQLLESQLIIPLESQKDLTPNSYYSFPIFLQFIAANNYQKYTGSSIDLMEISEKLIKKFREFQKKFVDKNTIKEDILEQGFKEYFQLIQETTQLQKSTIIDYSQEKQLAAYVNIFQIMRFHQSLNQYYVNKLQQKGVIEEPKSIIKTIIGSILPPHPKIVDFAYSINKLITTLPQIKHGILRRNKPAPNFHPLPNNDPRILTVDTRGVIFIFTEEYQDANVNLITELQFLDEKSVQQFIQNHIKQFILRNVCLDIIEQEIIIHPLCQTYLSDFVSEKQLFEWLLDRMDDGYNKGKLLHQYDQQDFYIRFKNPNEQKKQPKN